MEEALLAHGTEEIGAMWADDSHLTTKYEYACLVCRFPHLGDINSCKPRS